MILLNYTPEEKEKEANLSLSVNPFDYFDFIREVEVRQKEYFAKNIPELMEKIKASALVIIKILKDTTKKLGNNTDKTLNVILLLGYKFTFSSNNNILRKELLDAYALQLDLLKEKAPKRYEEIIKFIDDTLEETSTPIKTRTFKAKELKLDRSKVNKAIRDGREELYSETGLDVETGHKKNKSIYTPVLLNFVSEEELKKQGLTIEGIGYINPFDMEILMHAESLYEVGNKIMTADMLATQMNGGRRTQVTPKFKEEIYKSLMRLRLTNIAINTENEEKAGYNKHVIFSGVLLPNKIKSETAIINGKQIKEYIHVFDNSPLSEYADSKNQISRPPVNMLDVPGNLTREKVILVGYLARRIVDMQSPDEWRGKYIIRYETIFEYLKIEANSTQSLINKKNKIRQTVRAILEEWKRKDIINDFQELGEDDKPPKSRAPIVKIKITMPLKKIEADKNQ